MKPLQNMASHSDSECLVHHEIEINRSLKLASCLNYSKFSLIDGRETFKMQGMSYNSKRLQRCLQHHHQKGKFLTDSSHNTYVLLLKPTRSCNYYIGVALIEK